MITLDTHPSALPDLSDEATVDFLTDVLTTAAEGGIDYWAYVYAYTWRMAPAHRYLILGDRDDSRVSEAEATRLTLTLYHIHAAVQAIITSCTNRPVGADLGMHITYRRQVRNAWEERDAGDIDADLADMIIQVAALNSVVYG